MTQAPRKRCRVPHRAGALSSPSDALRGKGPRMGRHSAPQPPAPPAQAAAATPPAAESPRGPGRIARAASPAPQTPPSRAGPQPRGREGRPWRPVRSGGADTASLGVNGVPTPRHPLSPQVSHTLLVASLFHPPRCQWLYRLPAEGMSRYLRFCPGCGSRGSAAKRWGIFGPESPSPPGRQEVCLAGERAAEPEARRDDSGREERKRAPPPLLPLSRARTRQHRPPPPQGAILTEPAESCSGGSQAPTMPLRAGRHRSAPPGTRSVEPPPPSPGGSGAGDTHMHTQTGTHIPSHRSPVRGPSCCRARHSRIESTQGWGRPGCPEATGRQPGLGRCCKVCNAHQPWPKVSPEFPKLNRKFPFCNSS